MDRHDPTTVHAACFDDEARKDHRRKVPPKLASLRFKLGQKAKQEPAFRFYALYAHLLRVDVLETAFALVAASDGSKTPGVDGVTIDQIVNAEDGAAKLLADIREALRAKRYRSQAVKRVYIPKANGKLRPLGIPTIRDRVVQTAVLLLLEPIFDSDFMECSHGFRPGRSAHDALEAVQRATGRMKGGWIVEVDIRKFFDTVDHAHLRAILDQRIGDRVLLRLIGKWLNAGVVEGLALSYPDEGTPQGGVISPLLANIYLHTVLDEWFHRDIRPLLDGDVEMVRYADDFVMLFACKRDAERVLAVLPKRFGKFGLTLHPDKTRLVPFQCPDRVGPDDDQPGTFDLLGFTHYWVRSRKGAWIVKQRTAKDRFSRALRRLREWCRWHRHDPLEAQHLMLTKKIRGHYAYYGIWSNVDRLGDFLHWTTRAWKAALARRSQRWMTWATMNAILRRFPLPRPRIVRWYGT